MYTLYEVRQGTSPSRNGKLTISKSKSSRLSKKKKKKVREKSRECHNHKPQPFPDPKRKRKQTNLNKHKSNKRTKSTKSSSLFPKWGNRNTKRTEKHKNKMKHGKTYNKSPRRINHKATKSKTNTGTTALEPSSFQIPRSNARFNSLLLPINISPLKLYSVSSINIYRASNYNMFCNHVRIRLSVIKYPILQKYKNPYKRNGMYSIIFKCNAKSAKICICCNHLICRSTIISLVNYRQFSVVNNSDLDWKSEDVIYVLTCSERDWGMQYVGQPNGPLKLGFKAVLLSRFIFVIIRLWMCVSLTSFLFLIAILPLCRKVTVRLAFC